MEDKSKVILEVEETIELNWFGRPGKLFTNPWFEISFMGQKYGDAVNAVTAEYLLSGICCEHSVSIMGTKEFVDKYGDNMVIITPFKQAKDGIVEVRIQLKDLYNG